MKFTKMQGCGNDYVYINGFEEKTDNPGALSKLVSDRHFGVGSDGLVFILPSECADFQMAMYNSDGSRAEMCGNAIRCVGKYVYDNGMTNKEELSIETLAGIKKLKLFTNNGKVDSVQVDMGEPCIKAAEIPVLSDNEKVIDEAINVKNVIYHITCVSMGNPHAVVYMDEIKNLEIEKIGPLFEHHERFPKRTNTEFVKVISRNRIEMRVWERGAGETFACGTGACASAYASILNGLTDDVVDVEMLGGTLTISYDRDKNHIFMTGPAVKVFNGEF